MLAAFLLVASFFIQYAGNAHATVSNWAYKGAVIVPNSTEDLGSANLKRSLDQLRATGANSVAFVVQYYQSNLNSSDVAAGWNTPSDASLVAATSYAHSIGLQVWYKVHVDSYTGEWRANIDPGDRAGWFRNFGSLLNHLGQVAQNNNVEVVSVGTEMVRLTSTSWNGANTGYWVTLINNLRKVYGGKVTYAANSTSGSNDQYTNEKSFVGFWSSVDFVTLSPYYNLDYNSNDVNTLKRAWDYWNQNDIKPFQARIGKPIVFGEIGYRSVTDAYKAPWDWAKGGASDEQGQANDYTALLSYWNDYSYMNGVFFWNWTSAPNAYPKGNTEYTPQDKQAEGVMKTWFGGGTTPNPTPTPTPNPTPNPTPTPNPQPDFSNPVLNIWWPGQNVHVSGLQPFKGMLENHPLSDYQMWWQVDGDRLNAMQDNNTDWPHKEAVVDLHTWTWRGNGPYHLNFIVKDLSGKTVTQKPVDIFVDPQ